MTQSMVNILAVDDDTVDAMVIGRAFINHKIRNPVVYASDGLEALEILRGESRQKVDRPFLILLDINMPRMNGLEFLDAIRDDPELRDSIVFVLTTSKNEQDRLAAYQKNVAGYIVKSEAGEDFTELVTFLDNYWKIVEFPPAKK